MRNLIAVPLIGFAVILQSAVISRVTLASGYGDLLLVLLAAWALQPQVDSAWHWAFLAVILVSFVSRLPWPVIVVSYFSVIAIAQLLQRRVWQAPLLAMFSVTFLGTLLMHLLSFGVLNLFGTPMNFADVIGSVTLPSLLLNLLFAIPVYAFTRDIARWVYPDVEIE